MQDKILSLNELKIIAKSCQKDNKKIVHSHGVFDLLHIGHIRHFQQAKKLGDVLFVTVTPDKHVMKGPHRPIFNQQLRAEAIAAIDCVDYVIVLEGANAIEAIQLIKPQIYIKGSKEREQNCLTSDLDLEKDMVEKYGGSLMFDEDVYFSSSALINHYLPIFPKEVSDFLLSFSSKYQRKEVLEYLEKIRGL